MHISGVKKIAVLRANALGDFIFSLPALYALKETYSKSEIVLLAKNWHKDFLTNRQSPIDRVIVIPPVVGVGEFNSFYTNVRDLRVFFNKMKQEKFDIAIQLHGGGKYSNPFIRNLGAKLSVGLKTSDAMPLDINIPYIYYQSEYLRYLEVVSLIGVTEYDISPQLRVISQDLEEASYVLSGITGPFVVIHPGASDMRRRWQSKNFAKLGDFLARKGFSVVVTGTSFEKDTVSEVINQMKFPVINLCGVLTLSGLTGVLSLASLVISNDTGPFHVAYAIHTPVIGLFWCGNMINGAPLIRTTARPLISWMTACPLCGSDCVSEFPFQPQKLCYHRASFVSKIAPHAVEEAIDEMMYEGIIIRKQVGVSTHSFKAVSSS